MRMTHYAKAVLLAGVLALPLGLPALAGPRDTALLAQLEGNWRGRGNATGANSGPVACRMSFKPSGGDRLNYTGRCSLGGSGATSFRGTILYNEAKNRFESASSSQAGTAQVVGKRRGNSIVFSSSNVKTNYGVVSSTMTLAPTAIGMSFKMVDKEGKATGSSIKLTKG
ncbi:hypothetical protein [Devosia sp.]|uniref:hypothetical protein n=1 Tax=Devosia sp. TaxID=1871048 RepID=UPI003A952D3A